MAIIGVTHCPACGAVVNASWETCLACSSILELLNTVSTSLQAQAPLESAEPQLIEMGWRDTFKSGDDAQDPLIASNHLRQFYVGQTVAYRIPVVQHATSYFWESRTGTIDVIDIHNERLMIIPESEEQSCRIVSWCYCQPKASTDET